MLKKYFSRNCGIIKKAHNAGFETPEFEEEMKVFRKKIAGRFFDPLYVCGQQMPMLQQFCINLTKNVKTETITDEESIFIKRCAYGPIMHRELGAVIENMTQYDMNSSYGALLKSEKFYVPLQVGTICKLTEINNKQIGIYRLKIKGSPDPFCFRVSGDYKFTGFYTHYDIKMLEKLKVPFELDQEEENNACVWDKSQCAKGSDLFGEFLDQVYEAKLTSTGHTKEICKFLISTLYGQLIQIDEKEIPLDKLEKYNIDDVKSINIENETFLLKKSSFIYDLGRIKAFVYSLSRLTMGQIVLKLKKKGFKVVKVNTDCIVTDAPEENFNKIAPISDRMGDFKVEKKYNGKYIINTLHDIQPIAVAGVK